MKLSDAATYAFALVVITLVDLIWCRLTGDARFSIETNAILASMCTVLRAVRSQGATHAEIVGTDPQLVEQ